MPKQKKTKLAAFFNVMFMQTLLTAFLLIIVLIVSAAKPKLYAVVQGNVGNEDSFSELSQEIMALFTGKEEDFDINEGNVAEVFSPKVQAGPDIHEILDEVYSIDYIFK